jgi:cystathionine beta-synthase
VGKFLKEKKPAAKVIAIDPVGSIVYEYFKTGKALTLPKTYKIEGIGEDFIPKNYDLSLIDEIVQVEDKESFLMTRDLLTKEGLYSGVSSGSAVVGAIKWIKAQGEKMRGKNVLVILPDSGNRYLSKVYNDDWMREAGFLEGPSLGVVADVLHATQSTARTIVMAKPTDKVSAVIELMRTKDISQVPVADNAGWIKGVVTEGAILSALYEGRAKPQDPVENLADPSIEFVTPDDPVEKVSRLVATGKIPLVNDPKQHGKILGIITKIDLLTYLGNRT